MSTVTPHFNLNLHSAPTLHHRVHVLGLGAAGLGKPLIVHLLVVPADGLRGRHRPLVDLHRAVLRAGMLGEVVQVVLVRVVPAGEKGGKDNFDLQV